MKHPTLHEPEQSPHRASTAPSNRMTTPTMTRAMRPRRPLVATREPARMPGTCRACSTRRGDLAPELQAGRDGVAVPASRFRNHAGSGSALSANDDSSPVCMLPQGHRSRGKVKAREPFLVRAFDFADARPAKKL